MSDQSQEDILAFQDSVLTKFFRLLHEIFNRESDFVIKVDSLVGYRIYYKDVIIALIKVFLYVNNQDMAIKIEFLETYVSTVRSFFYISCLADEEFFPVKSYLASIKRQINYVDDLIVACQNHFTISKFVEHEGDKFIAKLGTYASVVIFPNRNQVILKSPQGALGFEQKVIFQLNCTEHILAYMLSQSVFSRYRKL